MTERPTIVSERVDDIPLVMAQMRRMGLPALIDSYFVTHGNRQGLSLGWTTVVWLAHVLSQGDHRLNQVQDWAARRLETLRACTGQPVQALDLSDDRLADVVRTLAVEEQWGSFERGLGQRLLRVYELPSTCVRLDMTTASRDGQVSAAGLFQFGYSKDQRPDVPQLKVALATLDPLGLPLATAVVPGNRADDPLYVPLVRRVGSVVLRRGVLYVGDCKMGDSTPRLAPAAAPPQSVQGVADSRPTTAWQELTVAEGAQGPRTYHFVAPRVWESRDGLPGRACWLLLRRNLEGSEPRYSLSNVPADTPVQTLAQVAAARWTIETEFETAKGEVGLDEHEVRSWVGWRHHITLALLAAAFLLTVQQDWGGRCPR